MLIEILEISQFYTTVYVVGVVVLTGLQRQTAHLSTSHHAIDGK